MYRYIPFFIATLLFLSCASKKAVVSPISVDSYVDTTKYTKTHNLSVDKHVNNSCVVFDADFFACILIFALYYISKAQT